MNMQTSEADFETDEEIVEVWENPEKTLVVALTGNEVLVKLSDMPKFDPMTGEPLVFPAIEDEE